MNHPARTGVALAATVAVGCMVCTVVFRLFPDAAANFMNALFHGLDFRKLQSGETLVTFDSFAYGFTVLVSWAFLVDTLFGWIRNLLNRERPAIPRTTVRA